MENKKRHDLGVLLIHGIGDSKEGDMLQKWGRELINELNVKCDVEVTSSKLRGHDRSYVSLNATQKGTSETKSILIVEAWWAEVFHRPGFAKIVLWSILALPWTLLSSVDENYRRTGNDFMEGWNSGFKERVIHVLNIIAETGWLFVGLVVTPILVLLLILLFLVSLIPWSTTRNMVLPILNALSGTLGDSYLFTNSDIVKGAIIDSVSQDLSWMAERAERRMILAHSQGAAVAHFVLKEAWEHPPRIDHLITYGSGLRKLLQLLPKKSDRTSTKDATSTTKGEKSLKTILWVAYGLSTIVLGAAFCLFYIWINQEDNHFGFFSRTREYIFYTALFLLIPLIGLTSKNLKKATLFAYASTLAALLASIFMLYTYLELQGWDFVFSAVIIPFLVSYMGMIPGILNNFRVYVKVREYLKNRIFSKKHVVSKKDVDDRGWLERKKQNQAEWLTFNSGGLLLVVGIYVAFIYIFPGAVVINLSSAAITFSLSVSFTLLICWRYETGRVTSREDQKTLEEEELQDLLELKEVVTWDDVYADLDPVSNGALVESDNVKRDLRIETHAITNWNNFLLEHNTYWGNKPQFVRPIVNSVVTLLYNEAREEDGELKKDYTAPPHLQIPQPKKLRILVRWMKLVVLSVLALTVIPLLNPFYPFATERPFISPLSFFKETEGSIQVLINNVEYIIRHEPLQSLLGIVVTGLILGFFYYLIGAGYRWFSHWTLKLRRRARTL